MIRFITISFIVFMGVIFSNASAQDFGFNGKKNTFSFFSTGGIRVFPLAFGVIGVGSGDASANVTKYNSSNTRKSHMVIVRYDVRASYTRLVNKKLGVGAEFGFEKFALPMNTSYFGSPTVQTTPVFNVFSYMLVLEFHPARVAAPVGLSSSIGIGPKFYSFDFKQNYRFDQSNEMDNPYPKGTSDIVAVNFFYQLNYKKVLNNFMTFDLGMRVHTGIVLPEINSSSINSVYHKGELRDQLFVHNLASLVSLRMGFSFLL